MFKVSNRNTRKRCSLLISKITLKTSERRHLTTSYLPEVTVQNHILNSFSQNIYQFAIKVLLSVLLSSLTARNFNKSRPIYVILWEIITEIFDSWKIQNVSIFYFWKNSPKNGQVFQLFTLYSKDHHFSITKLDILKNGIAYSTARNLKTAYLWNFHFR